MMGGGPEASFVRRAVAEFRDRAADRAKEDSPAAAVYRRVAEDLERMYQAHVTEPIDLTTGCHESGYSVSGLRGWMRRMGLQQLTRADLPRLARERDAVEVINVVDVAGAARMHVDAPPARPRSRAPRSPRGKSRSATSRATATAAILSR
jgi:hypothetical protein